MLTNGKYFDKLYFMVLENTGWSQCQNCKFVDYFNKYGTVFTNWIAAGHPSAPNYRALMSSHHWSWTEFEGIKRPNIGDHVPIYIEDFKGAPAERHNPFLDMKSTQIVIDEPANINYLGMDDMNDAHSASLDIADNNVVEAISQLTRKLNVDSGSRDLFFLVFDEAYGVTEWFTNHVFAGMIGLHNLILSKKQVHSLIHHQDFAVMLYDNWGIPLPNLSGNVNLNLRGKPLWELT